VKVVGEPIDLTEEMPFEIVGSRGDATGSECCQRILCRRRDAIDRSFITSTDGPTRAEVVAQLSSNAEEPTMMGVDSHTIIIAKGYHRVCSIPTST
jgi:hypothetical protein